MDNLPALLEALTSDQPSPPRDSDKANLLRAFTHYADDQGDKLFLYLRVPTPMDGWNINRHRGTMHHFMENIVGNAGLWAEYTPFPAKIMPPVDNPEEPLFEFSQIQAFILRGEALNRYRELMKPCIEQNSVEALPAQETSEIPSTTVELNGVIIDDFNLANSLVSRRKQGDGVFFARFDTPLKPNKLIRTLEDLCGEEVTKVTSVANGRNNLVDVEIPVTGKSMAMLVGMEQLKARGKGA